MSAIFLKYSHDASGAIKLRQTEVSKPALFSLVAGTTSLFVAGYLEKYSQNTPFSIAMGIWTLGSLAACFGRRAITGKVSKTPITVNIPGSFTKPCRVINYLSLSGISLGYFLDNHSLAIASSLLWGINQIYALTLGEKQITIHPKPPEATPGNFKKYVQRLEEGANKSSVNPAKVEAVWKRLQEGYKSSGFTDENRASLKAHYDKAEEIYKRVMLKKQVRVEPKKPLVPAPLTLTGQPKSPSSSTQEKPNRLIIPTAPVPRKPKVETTEKQADVVSQPSPVSTKSPTQERPKRVTIPQASVPRLKTKAE